MKFLFDKSEEKKLISLFSQHENNIDYLLFIKKILRQKSTLLANLEIKTLLDKTPFEKREFLNKYLLSHIKTSNDFIKKNLLWDLHYLKVDEFLNNPYLKAIKDIKFNEKGWSLTNKTIKAYEPFISKEEYAFGGDAIIRPSLGFFDRDYSYPSISLEDNEWMSLNPHEIKTMTVPILCAKGKVLTLGLGLGYFAYMVSLKEEVKEVHIVEMDRDLINIFNKYLLPIFPYPEKIHIHKADAFYFIESIKDKDYDFIFSDLWHDVSDGLSSYIKIKQQLDSFTYTQRFYWIEDSLITYLRLFTVGVMKDEYYHLDNEYDEIQLMIKKHLKECVLHNSYDIDRTLSIQGLLALVK